MTPEEISRLPAAEQLQFLLMLETKVGKQIDDLQAKYGNKPRDQWPQDDLEKIKECEDWMSAWTAESKTAVPAYLAKIRAEGKKAKRKTKIIVAAVVVWISFCLVVWVVRS